MEVYTNDIQFDVKDIALDPDERALLRYSISCAQDFLQNEIRNEKDFKKRSAIFQKFIKLSHLYNDLIDLEEGI